MDGTDCEAYTVFRESYRSLIDDLAEAGWTRSETRYRLVTLYPDIPRDFLDRFLAEHPEQFLHTADEALNGTLLAAGVWLAVNHLLDLGEDRGFIATYGDQAVVQDVSRYLESAGVSDDHTAMILGRIGATLAFLTQYPHTSLTSADYQSFRADPPQELREVFGLIRQDWPASPRYLSSQFGDGSWSRALVSMGLAPAQRFAPDGTDRIPDFTEDRFRSAIADFLTYCIRNNRKPLALLYGRWSADTARHTTPRPTLGTLRHRFGAWHLALAQGRRLINDEAPGAGDPRYEEHWVGPWGSSSREPRSEAGSWSPQHWVERGIGVVETVVQEASGDENSWAELVAEISEAIRTLPWKHFLTVEYDTGNTGGDSPYAQAFTGPGGVTATLVSEQFLPAVLWPLDEEYLVDAGWRPPHAEQLHWERTQLSLDDSATEIVDALRYGRDCSDPYRFRWGSGAMYDRAFPATIPTI
ncbi:TY-Chap domain-containing protein [Kocuria sp. HSID16901]|uniref:TY-Chap domain-containing protein n=1 Tax=Kocuria sp. HSID16901 TaxID=2419505 RepID=UPI00065F8402|nr:hypothetical protein [Kocuria sp. HSID16901]MCT1366425.1 hypothetical protein [Rothia sp. p3-SID1597]RUQ21286.1 hypothetical protein D8M21_07850 [Kocuria sp. HSID16901]